MNLVEEIYKITKLLPKDEKFALVDQLKRSSTSTVLNIAEGTGALGDKELNALINSLTNDKRQRLTTKD